MNFGRFSSLPPVHMHQMGICLFDAQSQSPHIYLVYPADRLDRTHGRDRRKKVPKKGTF